MIRLGYNSSGAITSGYSIIGINIPVNSASNVYFNSIYIGGTGVSSSAATYAFRTTSTSTTAREIQNNIFWNARSNGSGSAKNYAIAINNFTNLTCNYNDLYANGTGAIIGLVNTTDYTNISEWKALGLDAASISADPKFKDPTNATAPDLYIKTTEGTQVESAGVSISGITDDIEGNPRCPESGCPGSSSSPDLGADEGDFQGIDLNPPAISFTALANTQSTSNVTLTDVTINDASGVDFANKPRIYYKRSTDNNSLGATNDNTTNGWKWTETSSGSSPCSFSIDYSLLYNVGSNPVKPGDFIQYFVVAQDLALPNVGINPGNNFKATPASVALTSDAFPIDGTINQYWILPSCGTFTVGPTGHFSNLTAVAAALNTSTINCDIIFELQSNYDGTSGETFPIVFNQFATSGGDWTATVRPASDVVSILTIAGTPAANTPLISFDGVDRLTFDGRKGGAGTDIYWVLQNTAISSIGPVINIINDATSNTLQYLDIQGGSNITSTSYRYAWGNVCLYSASGTGCDYNTITNCKIHEYSTSYYPRIGLYTYSTSSTYANDNLTITNNEIFNFTVNGIYNYYSGNTCNIEYNHFYNTANVAPAADLYAIFFTPVTTSTGHKISNNNIGGHTTSCGDPIWSVSSSYSMYFIYAGQCSSMDIKNNTIQNIRNTYSSGSLYMYGIYIAGSGTFDIDGNTIGHKTTAANGLINDARYSIYGIYNASSGNLSISNNTFANLQSTYAGTSVNLYGIYTTGGTNSITGNQIYNLSSNTTSTTDPSLAGIYNTSTASSSVQTISGNTIYNLSITQTGSYAHKISGIYHNGASAITNNIIEKNIIYNLSLSSSNTAAEISGIKAAASYTTTQYTYSNNMIRLGYNSDGAITTGYSIIGINIPVNTYSNFYFNSVYIGGTGISSSSATYAFNTTSTATTSRNIQNNIFWNARSNGSGTAKNYAIKIYTTTGLTSNYNDLYASGTGAVLGVVNTTDYADITAWKALGIDASSISGDPKFKDPTNATTPDLHISTTASTQLESGGVSISGITDDIDGNPRYGETEYSGSGSAPDIGADEGDFQGLDLNPPAFVFIDIANTQSTANITLTDFADITDLSGVNGTTNKPRLYFKKSTDANDNTGWKYVTSSSSSSPFSFTIDYSILNDGSVVVGDEIQYFVVAQDEATTPNVGINSGNFSNPQTSVALAANAFPITGTIKSYFILLSPGTYTVGTGGNYPNLTGPTGFFQAVNTLGTLTADIYLKVKSDLTEDGTNALNKWTNSGGTWKVVISSNNAPASPYLISGSVANNGMIRLNGVNDLIIDGSYRTDITNPATSDGKKYLQFRNTNTANPCFTFTGDASNNTITNCYIESANATATSGTILFTTPITTGSDNNTISYCDIKDASGVLPANAIYSAGASGKLNTNNIIDNCNIYNYFLATGNTSGITLASYSDTWQITNNRFYQEATRNFTSASTYYGINIAATTCYGITITGNVIGFANSSGTGTMTIGTNSYANKFWGIYIAVSNTSATSVQNNTIAGISHSSSAGNTTVTTIASSPFVGIYVAGGLVNIGNEKKNIIGNQTTGAGSASIYLVNSYASGVSVPAFGIVAQGSYAVNISNNEIGSVQMVNTTQYVGFTAIRVESTGGATVANNIIGGPVANSIQINPTGSGANLIGINSYSSGAQTITGNTISNLTHIGANAGITTSSSLIGILSTSTTAGQTITQNTIHTLTNTTGGATAVNIIGLYYAGPTSGLNVISRNSVHSMNLSSTSASAVMYGMYFASGLFQCDNNMIRLGVDGSGAGINTGYIMYGIYHAAATYANDFYHNSVYIGGAPVATSSSATYSFYRSSTATNNILNNIFYNARSNNGATGSHYAIYTSSTTGLTSDYNILYAPNTGGKVGLMSGTACTTLRDWRINAPNQDLHSASADPNFVNATGNSSTVSLKIQGTTPAEGYGLAISGIDYDNEGDIRSNYTPVDIGADAGAYTASADIYTPAISYSTLTGQIAACGNVTLTVTIIDQGTGIYLTGTQIPKFYIRRTTGGATSWFPITGTYTGDAYNSVWTFVVDYTADMGITAAVSDVFQYFVVAKDQAGNIWSSKFDASTPTFNSDDISSLNTAPTTPDTYTIGTANPMSGTVTVGASGADYTSFSATGGLFSAINTNGLSGDLTVYVTSSISAETGAVALGKWTEYCGTGYYVYIYPADNNSQKVIEGSYTTSYSGLIRFDGATRVVIDGWYNGETSSTRNLKFYNNGLDKNYGSCTMHFLNNSTYITVKHTEIESKSVYGNRGSHVVYFGYSATSGTGNSYITLDNNRIGTVSPSTYFTINCIYSSGGNGSGASPNHDNIIINNEIVNFAYWTSGGYNSFGIRIGGNSESNYANNYGNNGGNWNISNNSFYVNGPSSGYTGQAVAIYFIAASASGCDGNIISGNYFGGTAAQCGGSAMSNAFCSSFIGIYYDSPGSAVISNNIFKNINTASKAFTGISANGSSGTVLVQNNIIGDPDYPISGSMGSTSNGFRGIVSSPSGATINIDGNTIQNMNITTGFFYGINHWTPTYPASITNNIIKGNTVANGYDGSASTFQVSSGIYFQAYSGNGLGHNIEGNIIEIPKITNSSYCGAGITLECAQAGDAVGGTIINNKIYDVSTSAAQVFGINMTAWYNPTYWTIANNMILLSNIPSSSAYSAGIEDETRYYDSPPGLNKYYNNTIYLKGSGSGNSYCLLVFPTQSTGTQVIPFELKNNILINARSSTNKSFAIGNLSPVSSWQDALSVSDNNLLVANNSSSYIASQNGTGKTLATWRTTFTPNIDLNSTTATYTTGSSSYPSSLNPENLFINTSTTDLHIKITDGQSLQFVNNKGTDLSSNGITSDIDDEGRDGLNPDIGADEFCLSTTTQPTVIAATNVGSTTFTANWNAVSGATGYLLYVSSDETFASGMVSGYDGLNVGNNTTYDVSGLSAGGVYYYRFRPLGAEPCLGGYSTVQLVSLASPPVIITDLSPSGTISKCEGDAITFSAKCNGTSPLTYDWYVGGSLVQSSTENSNVMVSYTNSSLTTGNSGNYYCIIHNSLGSVTTNTAVLNVYTIPITPTAGNNGPVCVGSSLTLSANTISGATYEWSGPNNYTNLTQNPSVSSSATTAMAGIYSVIATVNGCVSSAGTTEVTVNALPNVVATPGIANICTGSSIELSASGAISYEWSPATNLSSTTGTPVTATVTTNITYTVTGTDANNCTNTAMVILKDAGSYSSGLSGSKTVGSGGDYPDFLGASGLFNALNTYGLAGDLNVTVISSITETGTTPLNNFPSCGGPYTVTIGTLTANTTVSGNYYNASVTRGLFAFLGAGNVIINGSVGSDASGFLTFKNTNGMPPNATFSFENDANNITIKNCNINGTVINNSQQYGDGYPGNSPAYIFIGNGTSTGNFNITIDHNNIGTGSSDQSDQCIIAKSTTKNNHDINITNNNIANFYEAGYTTNNYGIYVYNTGTGSANNWNISGNSFYKVGSLAGAYSVKFIYFNPGTSSTGNIINGNYLGGNGPQCEAGTPGYYYHNACCTSSYTSNLIDVNCGSITISNNVIKNIRFINTSYPAPVVVMNIAGTTIANITGNQIGDDSYEVSTRYSTIQGIYFSGTNTGTQISNNTIKNLKCNGGNPGGNGIFIYPSSNFLDVLINGNIVEVPRSTNNSSYNSGIQVYTSLGGSKFTGSIINNRIYDYSNSSSGANYGLNISVPAATSSTGLTVANNQIALRNPNGSSLTQLIGILDWSGTSGYDLRYLYNSVYIGGTASSGNSYAYYIITSSSGPVRTFRNNIFINTRSGGSGPHVVMSNTYSDANWTSSTSDYNLLLSSGASNCYIGRWGSNYYSTLSEWQNASGGGDANSFSPTYTSGSSSYPTTLNPANLFTGATTGDLHINSADGQSYQFVSNNGLDLTSSGISTDYDGETRCPGSGCPGGSTSPDIGADEYSSVSCSPVVVASHPSNPAAVCEGAGVANMTVTVTGTANFDYQWQINDGGWQDLVNGGIYGTTAVTTGSASNSNTLTITNADVLYNNKQYRCIITNCSGANTAASNAATLSVNTVAAITAYSPVSKLNSVCEGSSTYYELSTSGAGLTYQWYVSDNGIDNWNQLSNVAPYSGVTTVKLEITNTPSSLNGKYYRCIITGTCSPAATSDVCSLVVSTLPYITAEPQPDSKCSGTSSLFSVTATGSGISYQWQENGVNISGEGTQSVYTNYTTETLDISDVTGLNGKQFRCVVSGLCPSPATSENALLTVIDLPTITGTTPGWRCNTGTVDISATTSAGTVNWYSEAIGGTSIGSGSPWVTPSINSSRDFYVEANNAGCLSVTRTAVRVTIDTVANIAYHPADATTSSGKTIIFSISSMGEGITYQWQENKGTDWADISNGGTNPTYSGVTTNTLQIVQVQSSMNGYQYRCVVSSVCSISLNSEPATLTVLCCSISGLWTGLLSTDWNTGGNWDDGFEPGSSTPVTIPGSAFNQPIIASGHTGLCSDITILPRASLLVEGTLIADGKMEIKSDASGTGALNNTDAATVNINGNVVVERYLPDKGYHYMTSPLINSTFGQLNDDVTLKNLNGNHYNPDILPPANKLPNVWLIDEAHTHNVTYDQNAWQAPGGLDDIIEEMRGFALVVASAGIKIDFEGSGSNLYKGNRTYSLTKTEYSTDLLHNDILINQYGKTDAGGVNYGFGPGNGWHLIGNPYPSPVDWDAVKAGGGIGADISHTLAYFKSTSLYAGVYGYYNPTVGASGAFYPSQYIPSMQAFLLHNLQVTPGSSNLSFRNSYRTVNSEALGSPFYKKKNNEKEKLSAKISLIRLSVRGEEYKSNEAEEETVIGIAQDATEGFDNYYDAQKLFNSEESIPNLFTRINNINLAVNIKPTINLNDIIPLYFKPNKDGKYIIKLSEAINIPSGLSVYLTDLQTGVIEAMDLDKIYTFISKTTDNPDRFLLSFSKGTGISGIKQDMFSAYYNKGLLYISYDSDKAGKLEIYNSTGQKISDKQLERGAYKLAIDGAKGVYILRMLTNNKVYTNKFIID